MFLKYLILVLFISCASNDYSYEELSRKLDSNKFELKREEIDQLASLGGVYKSSPDVSLVKISKKSKKYLESIYSKLVVNNELILKGSGPPSFTIVKNKAPFHFSLPKSQFFFSTGLLERFLDNEDLFISVLSYEIIKSYNNVYKSTKLIPVGFIDIERLLSLVKVDLSIMVELKKWAFFILKRADYDPFAILNWIQIQNKNILDFSLMNIEPKKVFQEEFIFKNFIVSQGLAMKEQQRSREASKQFYKFLREVKVK